MHVIIRAALLAAIGTLAGQARAQSEDYGTAVSFTKRNCPADATIACDGRGTGQTAIAQRTSVGGSGKQVNASFAATGTGVGSTASASATFGAFGLPTINASVNAIGSVRLSTFVASYQVFTYTGQAALEDLRLSAAFHIDGSSTDGGNGTRPGGAIAAAGFAIWNEDDFYLYADSYFTGTGNFSNPTSLTNQSYLFGAFGCDDFAALADPQDLPAGPRAIGQTERSLSGGETTLGITQQTCGEDTLTLEEGEEFVIASFVQLVANRNGFIDATGTFTLGLDPTMSAADAQAFRQNTSFASAGAVPEPATWAMVIAGFGAIGGTLRRRGRAAGTITA